jgi:2-phospho-L-lactate guanylyltransferase
VKAIILPVKNPERGKTRLSGFLSMEERRQVAWAMFCDVTAALAKCAHANLIVVVTSFERAGERAQSLGFQVMVEESQSSESQSVDWASGRLAGRGVDAVLRLPADIPLVQPGDIDDLIGESLSAPATLLVPSREGTGTNAILRMPPELFPSHFGPGSLALHLKEAASVRATVAIVNNPRIALDIDEPSDIETFLPQGAGTETFDTLMELKITDRLASMGTVSSARG